MVELSDGSVAEVLAPNAKDLARPRVRAVITPGGRRVAPAEVRVWSPLPPEMSVRRVLAGGELPQEGSQAA